METGLEKKTDDEVIEALHDAVRHERAGTARVIVCLVEFLKRRLINKRAYPSLFEYFTSQLGYSEGAAFKRIRVAKAAQEHLESVTLLEERRSDVRLLCRSHNAGEARRCLGDANIDLAIQRSRGNLASNARAPPGLASGRPRVHLFPAGLFATISGA